MGNVRELQSAVKYPFTQHARDCLQSMDMALENIPAEVQSMARQRIVTAYLGKPFQLTTTNYRTLLEHSLLSFPLAKAYLSALNDPNLNEKFAQSVADAVWNFLNNESNPQTTALEIAADQGIDVDVNGNEITLRLMDYLKAENQHAQLQLVNQQIDRGRVHISLNVFLRWISEYAFAITLQSLSASNQRLPADFLEQVQSLKKELAEVRSKALETRIPFTGDLNLNWFPECMRSLYTRLHAGENLPHNARFALATFLNALNIPPSHVLELFSHASNFNEKITRYHLNYIAKKGYPAPSCKKMREQALACEICRVKTPMQFYRNQLKSISPKESLSSPNPSESISSKESLSSPNPSESISSKESLSSPNPLKPISFKESSSSFNSAM